MAEEYSRDWPEHDDVTSYTLRIPSEDWKRWRDTVPRSTPLYIRLRELIADDAATTLAEDIESAEDTLAEDWGQIEQRLACLLADRIKHRTRTARNALENGDEKKAHAQLDKIQEVAETFK